MKAATRRRRFPPFARLHGGGVLRVDAVRVDGRALVVGDDPAAPLALTEHARPRHAIELDLSLELPDGLADCLVPGEEPQDAVAVLAVAEDPTTWFRAASHLRPVGERLVRGTLAVPARAVDRRFEVTALLLRRRSPVERVAGRASEKGARLGATAPRVIVLDPGRPATGGLLDVRPARFSTAEALRRWAGQPWFLQVTADPPILWLNEELPDVAGVLAAKGTTGRRARLRDLLFRAVGLQTWTTLLHAAVSGVTEVDGEVIYALAWHEAALRTVAQHAYAELPRAERLPRLLANLDDARDRPEHLPTLLEDLALGVARHVDLADVIGRAVSELASEFS